MPRNRKNNHYHFAEKFDDRRNRRAVLLMPKRTVFVAVLFLLVFGVITMTFSSSINATGTVNGEIRENSIIVNVRNAMANNEFVLTREDRDLASTGFDVTSGAVVYFYAPDGWDIDTYNKVQLMIGHQENNNNWSTLYSMTRIGTTRLYYYTFTNGYGNFNQLCFIANTSYWSGNSEAPSTRKVGAHHRTNTWASSNILGSNYVFRAASSSNDADLSSKTGNSSNTLLNSSFNIYSWTKFGNDVIYSNNGKGGKIKASGTTKTGSSTTSTQATSAETSVSNNTEVIYPMIGTQVTLTNTPSTGYVFDGYKFDFESNNPKDASSPMWMNSWGDEATNVYALFHEVMHNIRVYNDVNSSVDTNNTSSVGVYTSKTITAPTIPGYTFSNWSTLPSSVTLASGSTVNTASITFTYSSDSTSAENVDLTANYTINPPTSVSLADFTCDVGDSVSLSPTISPAAPSGITYNTSYSVSGSGASITNGSFEASLPGTYTITTSVTATDGTKTSAPTTTTTAVTVYPVAPDWTLTMYGFEANGSNPESTDAYGTQGNPYMVSLGSNFSFKAEIDDPEPNYTYVWYTLDSSENPTVLARSAGDPADGSSITFGSAQATEATTATIRVKVYCVAYYNNASTLTVESEKLAKYYYIKSLIESFVITPFQKIYTSPNDVSMNATYTITSGDGYNTGLWFSSDNRSYFEAKHENGLITNFTDALQRYIYAAGVKYFYLNVSNTAGTLNAKTDVIHTTVGTDQKLAVKPVYFINNEATTEINLRTDNKYRVMAFYVDGNGDLKYQTAQDVFRGVDDTKKGLRYRAYVPYDATAVSFAICKKGKYSIPGYDGSDINYLTGSYQIENSNDYTNPFFYAFTDLVTLDDSKNTIKANTKSLVSGYSNDDDYALYSMNVTYLPYQTVD